MGVRSRLRGGIRRVRIRLRRGGADESGLAGLVELSFVNAAGDALVAVALAGKLFFAVPVGEARSKVALYLLITMAPFALLAPVIGPLLDRLRGRRTAMAAACLARGLLAWQLAGSLSGLGVYPLALGLLVLSRSFGVARSAVIPRVTPPGTTLVAVNSRMSLVNISAGVILAPIGLGLAHIPFVGYSWVLRLCAVVYLAGVLLSFNLPAHVDSAAGERTVHVVQKSTGPGGRGRLRRALGALPVALRSATALRALIGFLTFFLAFLLRTGGGNNAWLGALAASAGAGGALGVFIGGKLSRHRPELLLVTSLLMGATGCVGAAFDFKKLTSLAAALLAMMAASMGKLALDAVIQRDVPEEIRNSAFARSETALQLAWVLGGAIGLIPMSGVLGFSLAAAAMVLVLVLEAGSLRRSRLRARARRRAAPPASAEAPTAELPTTPSAEATWGRRRGAQA